MTEPPSDSKTRTVGTGISGTRNFGKGDDWEVNLSAYFNKTTDDNAMDITIIRNLEWQFEGDSRDRPVDAFGKRKRL